MNATSTTPDELSNFQVDMGHRCSKALYYSLKYPFKKKNLAWPSAAMKKNSQIQKGALRLYLKEIGHSDTSIPARHLQEPEAKILIGSTFSGLIGTPSGQWIRVDLLRRIESNWELLIVTGQTKKERYQNIIRTREYDIWRILRFLPVDKIQIVWNKENIGKIGPFFIEEDVTNYVKFRAAYSIDAYVDAFNRMRAISDKPEVIYGPHCGIGTSAVCPFTQACLPEERNDNIFFLTKVSPESKLIMARRGLHRTKDIPMTYAIKKSESIVLRQSTVEPPQILASKITAWLCKPSPQTSQKSRTSKSNHQISRPLYSFDKQSLHFPIAFLDFEADRFELPIFPNTQAPDYTCFQYSLHYYLNKESEVIHCEFLADPINEDNDNFLSSLLEDLAPVINKNGLIVVYNASFEKTRLEGLRKTASEAEGQQINRIIANLVDIHIPFRRMYFLDATQKGRTTLKAVYESIIRLVEADPDRKLPRLIRHKDLRIKNGVDAVRGYWVLKELLMTGKHPKLENKVRAMLLEYCALDTSSMVVILDYLIKIAGLK